MCAAFSAGLAPRLAGRSAVMRTGLAATTGCAATGSLTTGAATGSRTTGPPATTGASPHAATMTKHATILGLTIRAMLPHAATTDGLAWVALAGRRRCGEP